jgi:hypothetical protein
VNSTNNTHSDEQNTTEDVAIAKNEDSPFCSTTDHEEGLQDWESFPAQTPFERTANSAECESAAIVEMEQRTVENIDESAMEWKEEGNNGLALKEPEPEWMKPKLKPTASGESLRQCGEAKVTRPKKKSMCFDVNVEANPMVLKSTGLGSTLRSGGDIVKPIVRDPMRDINFEANPAFALRETDTGKSIKNGRCLQKPITNVKKSAAAHVNFDANPAILLRSTETGKIAKEKGNLQKPITNVIKDETAHINAEANPMTLRLTDKGASVRLGADIIKPVTRDPMADINFEANPTFVLRSTETGKVAKGKGNLQKPITCTTDETAHINSEANPMLLRTTDKGAAVRLGGDIVKPLIRDPMADINFEANPTFVLRESDTGKSIKEGLNLQKPITNVIKPVAADINFDANPSILLRRTEAGQVAKEKGNLQKPITKATTKDDETAHINNEANPMRLRLTEKGASVRLGKDLVKPVTHDLMADVNFEANPTFVLRESDTGKSIKEGISLQKPITNVVKPAATDSNFDSKPAILLRSTESGRVAKEKGDLQKPITKATTKDETAHINVEVNPMMLRPTDKGAAVRLGGDIVKPLIRDPMADVNFEANPTFALRERKLERVSRMGVACKSPLPTSKSLPLPILTLTRIRRYCYTARKWEKGNLKKPIPTNIRADEAAHINVETIAMILQPITLCDKGMSEQLP